MSELRELVSERLGRKTRRFRGGEGAAYASTRGTNFKVKVIT